MPTTKPVRVAYDLVVGDTSNEGMARAGDPPARLTGDNGGMPEDDDIWDVFAGRPHELCLARRADGDLEQARHLATTAAATATEYGSAGLTNRAAALLATI